MISLPLKFWGYLKKDFLLLAKRKKYLYLSLGVPLLIALIFILMVSPGQSSIDVGVCDFDDTERSREAIRNLENFDAEMLSKNNCLENLKSKVRSGDLPAGIEIGKGFTSNLKDMNQTKIVVYYDATNVAFSNMISWRVDSATNGFERVIIDSLNEELKGKVSSARDGLDIAKGLAKGPIKEPIQDIDSDLKEVEKIKTEFLVDPIWVEQRPLSSDKGVKGNSIAFIVPIVLMFTLLMISSTSFIYDKRNGFLARVKKSTSLSVYLVSKLAFFFALALVQFLIVYLLYFVFGVSYEINVLNILHLVLAISLINTLVGLAIGIISDNEGVAVLLSLVIAFPLMLLSGIFYPVQTMSEFMQFLVNIMPLSHQISISKEVLLFNQDFNATWAYFGLAGFLLVWYLANRKSS